MLRLRPLITTAPRRRNFVRAMNNLRGSFQMGGVLSGIRVVEQGTFITGPCAGMMLADLGADVIKVESPEGDPYRSYQGEHYSPHFQAYNRNKRSIAFNLKNPSERSLFNCLVTEADVFIQNFRPGTAERLGAGHEQLCALNPRLIYGSISGFGSSGPYADRPSYDSVAQALSGFLSVVVDSSRPRFLGPALADAITGIYAAYGVLGALVQRGRTGEGCLVEVSMLEAMAHFAVEPFAAFFALGNTPTSSDRPRLAQAYILRTADSRLIAIHLSSLEKFWDGLVAALSAPELASDERFSLRTARIANYEALNVELDRRFSQHGLSHWVERLESNDVPYAPINPIDEVIHDRQVEHLGLIVPVECAQGGTQAVRPPVQFGRARSKSVRAAPSLNQHGPAIRDALARGERWPGLNREEDRVEA
jgi:crotonobetainyl-CoA:carnitine CoA-transferase CaiB-like acyl-CoA transferase